MEKINTFCIFVVVHSRSRSRSLPTWVGTMYGEDTSTSDSPWLRDRDDTILWCRDFFMKIHTNTQ